MVNAVENQSPHQVVIIGGGFWPLPPKHSAGLV